MTAAVQEPAGLERLPGTVGEAMTRALPEQGSYDSPLAGLLVRDLMSEDPVTARPDWPLIRGVRAVIDHGVNRLPVVDRSGRPLGILTRDDVLRAVAGPPGTSGAGA